MGTVARAEPATEVTSLTNGNTAQMRAHTYRNESVVILNLIHKITG